MRTMMISVFYPSSFHLSFRWDFHRVLLPVTLLQALPFHFQYSKPCFSTKVVSTSTLNFIVGSYTDDVITIMGNGRCVNLLLTLIITPHPLFTPPPPQSILTRTNRSFSYTFPLQISLSTVSTDLSKSKTDRVRSFILSAGINIPSLSSQASRYCHC